MKSITKIILFLILLASCKDDPSSPAQAKNQDVLQKLNSLPGVIAKEISPQNGFERQFEIYLSQPIDHSNPTSSLFNQRIFISHKSETAPVIFLPSGYSSSPIKVSEICQEIPSNQVYAAHRFMAGARPGSMEWQYLDILQASSDFHRVVELLKEIYKGPWISYGVSKNGQAALFHRRYFPEDVKGTVVISAPLSLGAEDPRYEHFLNTVGSQKDRENIKAFQRRCLFLREEIIPYINNYIDNSEFTFTRMDAGKILEYEVLEFPFSFWQSTSGNSSDIPDSTTGAFTLFSYLKNFGYFDFYSDELLSYYEPVYYQAFTELGWYRLVHEHLSELLVSVPDPSYLNMCPQNVSINFNQAIIPDIINWLQQYGNDIIYLYGSNDPWSAGAIESIGSTNAIKIVREGGNHLLRISDLDEKNLVYSKIRGWLKN